ncbi:RHS repeat domain-containing protein [Pseudomonas sp. IT-P291]|uniref:RHS repeat domain-containing protein n=1 Tax=Pseudomonas sp. IT-P291 TaxID=3026448 RepID=UPI0039DF4B66
MNSNRVDSATPTITVTSSRGLHIRHVAYCRSQPDKAPDTRTTRHIYDPLGRKTASWDPRLLMSHLCPNVVETFSLSGQVLLAHSVDAGWRAGLINEAGHPVSIWDSRGSQRHVEYDMLQRPVAITEQLIAAPAKVVERLTYGDANEEFAVHNQCSQLIRHDDPVGTLHFFDYGLSALLLTETRQFLDSLDLPDWPLEHELRSKLLENQCFKTSQLYCPTDEIRRKTDAMGNSRLFGYTVAGELVTASLQMAGAGRQPRVLISNICRNAFGQVQSENAGNGVRNTAEYAAEDGRLTSLLTRLPGGKIFQHLHYAYDPVGNVISVEKKHQPVRYFKNQRIETISYYCYDSLYQLIEAKGRETAIPSNGPELPTLQPTPLDPLNLRNYTQSFQYDAAGNLQTRSHSSGPTYRLYTSKTSNRSMGQRADGSLPDESDIAMGFDPNGNQQALVRGQLMHWDVRNQLSLVTMVKRDDGPDDEECYRYDHSGHRLRKVRLTHCAKLILKSDARYLPGLEIHRDAVGNKEHHVISVTAGRSNVRVLHWVTTPPDGINSDTVRYCMCDHLDSCSLELDETASLLTQEEYYPFGGTACQAGRSAIEAEYKTIRYSGKERDATGLYYYGYRYYAPWLQRWISPDPAADVDGLNLFKFVHNGPISAVDHKGLKWISHTAGGITFDIFESENITHAQQIRIKTNLLNLLPGTSEDFAKHLQAGKLNVPDSLYTPVEKGKYTILETKFEIPESCIQSTEFLLSYMAGDISDFDYPGEVSGHAKTRKIQTKVVFSDNISLNISSDEMLEEKLTSTNYKSYFEKESESIATVGEGIMFTQTLDKKSVDRAGYLFHFMPVTGIILRNNFTGAGMLTTNLVEPIRNNGEELRRASNWQVKFASNIFKLRPSNFTKKEYISGMVRPIRAHSNEGKKRSATGSASTIETKRRR